MSEIYPETPTTPGVTLGEVYWRGAMTDPDDIGAWPTLAPEHQADIERGAQAVAAHVLDASVEKILAAIEPQPAPVRYALVEQMGHRATVATIRETTFCGKQMIEATDLKGGGISLIAPESLYEVTWLTEDQAHTRIKPWTAIALPAAQRLAYDEDEQRAADLQAHLSGMGGPSPAWVTDDAAGLNAAEIADAAEERYIAAEADQ